MQFFIVGSYGGYSFSASYAMEEISEYAESSQTVNYDRKENCNYGFYEYNSRDESITHQVTESFFNDFMSLGDLDSDEQAYFDFFEYYGTASLAIGYWTPPLKFLKEW